MISRIHRFHGYGSLRYVYTKGKTVRAGHCTLKYAPNPKRTSYRAAVVVSKKVSKSAVVRNRIRRRVYEIIRKSAGSITSPYDIVVLVFHEEIATMEAPRLEETITSLLRRADIIHSQ